MLANPIDDQAIKRIINVPKRGIGATTVNRVQAYAEENEMSFYDALRQADQIPGLGRSASKLEPFVTLIQSFRAKLEYYTLKQLPPINSLRSELNGTPSQGTGTK